jgi:hypothetical protein
MQVIGLANPRRSIEFSHELRLEAALCIFPAALEILLTVVSQHVMLPPHKVNLLADAHLNTWQRIGPLSGASHSSC